MNCIKHGCLIMTFFICLSSAFAQTTPKSEIDEKEINAFRIDNGSPTIDGLLDDAVWSRNGIEYARGFTQRAEDEGMPATESTLVAVAYDDEAI